MLNAKILETQRIKSVLEKDKLISLSSFSIIQAAAKSAL
jgi:hypothetical protein